MKNSMTIEEIASEIRKRIDGGTATQASIAMELGMDQSQLSRIIRGQFKRLSPHVRNLCSYAHIDVESIVPCKKHQISKKLRDVVEEVWDGSVRHERALIKTIKSLQHL